MMNAPLHQAARNNFDLIVNHPVFAGALSAAPLDITAESDAGTMASQEEQPKKTIIIPALTPHSKAGRTRRP